MIRNNNTNERGTKMLHLDEIVASKMEKGLTTEADKIKDIGRVLTEMGKSLNERIWLLSHDEDFIPDVLEYLKTMEIKPVSEMRLIEPRRNTKWLEKGFLYEVVSEVDSFGYFKVKEPRSIGKRIRFIHKNNMKEVKVI